MGVFTEKVFEVGFFHEGEFLNIFKDGKSWKKRYAATRFVSRYQRFHNHQLHIKEVEKIITSDIDLSKKLSQIVSKNQDLSCLNKLLSEENLKMKEIIMGLASLKNENVISCLSFSELAGLINPLLKKSLELLAKG